MYVLSLLLIIEFCGNNILWEWDIRKKDVVENFKLFCFFRRMELGSIEEGYLGI